uniref:GGDEF domain-containing protein n=1 Tax=Ningiella ruwaisensis TaxID=2364274 RepID=UPI00109FBC0C|nr:GGDEF domain-containing protein [Ningiella ruwaisensis]
MKTQVRRFGTLLASKLRREFSICSLLMVFTALAAVSSQGVAQSIFDSPRYQSEYQEMLKAPQKYLSSSEDEDFRSLSERLQRYVLRAQAYTLTGNQYDALEQLINARNLLENSNTPSVSPDAPLTQAQREFASAYISERLSDAYLSINDLMDARLAISDAINDTSMAQIEAHQTILVKRLQKRAQIDYQLGANISALQDLQLALQIANSLDLTELIVELSTLTAVIHQERNEHTIALEYVNRALPIAEATEESEDEIKLLSVLIPSLMSARNLEDAEIRLAQLNSLITDSSQLHFNLKALQFAGELSFLKGDYRIAIERLKSALQLNPNKASVDAANAHLLISRAYTELDDMDAAIEHLVEAFNALENSNANFDLVQSIHLHRAELLSRLNQFEEAYKVTKDVIAARDINQPIDEIKRMLDMHTNFQLQLQQQENIALKEQNAEQSNEIEDKQMLNRLYILVSALLFCISCLLLLLFIRSRKHRQNLEMIAHTDALTGLYSRRRIMEILEFQQDMFNRNLLPYCVAIVDLDYFKKINDTYGHQTGDTVLKQTAQLAKESFRKTDSLGRIGGEEFLFIFPDTPLPQCQRLLKKYAKQLLKVGKQANIEQATTASIGLVQAEENESTNSIISRADKALYKAKNSGRNQIVTESFES